MIERATGRRTAVTSERLAEVRLAFARHPGWILDGNLKPVRKRTAAETARNREQLRASLAAEGRETATVERPSIELAKARIAARRTLASVGRILDR